VINLISKHSVIRSEDVGQHVHLNGICLENGRKTYLVYTYRYK